ncbi:ATP-binding protein [Nonomuraea sp. B12E4]|uniref:ATP-binding protein n=1 Tax=Nonomuraea sp. B12E4 TaxID=3153564 RepID=UPI00325D191C
MDTGTALADILLPGVTASVPVARHCVRAVLAGAGCQVGDVLLVVTELVANAVEHTRSGIPGGRICIKIQRVTDGLIGIEVVDFGAPTVPYPRKPLECWESGRGLGLVDALSETWGVRRFGEEQSAVWAHVLVDMKEENVVR